MNLPDTAVLQPPADARHEPPAADLFLEALRADGPAPALGAAASVYDWLIGSWQADVVDYDADGSRRESRGEWHFAWVLEGRAVQDVWIAPRRDERGPSMPAAERNRYGSTIRVYDPAIEAWRVDWINPVRQVHTVLVGRRVGEDIVQTGWDDDGSFLRWSFCDITTDSFTWRGERSADGGTWHVEAEFFARRIFPERERAGR